MSINSRIKDAVKAGVKASSISKKSGVSYFRISSVVNPEKYRGESTFNEEETTKIEQALDSIKEAL